MTPNVVAKPRRRPVDAWSTVSLTCALLLLGPFALGAGILGRRRTQDNPRVGGYEMATWGFFIGMIETVIWVFIGIALLVVRAYDTVYA